MKTIHVRVFVTLITNYNSRAYSSLNIYFLMLKCRISLGVFRKISAYRMLLHIGLNESSDFLLW